METIIIEEDVLICTDCDNVIDSGKLCESCEKNYCDCHDCGEHILIDDSQSINGDTYCQSCADEFSYCEECDCYVPSDDTRCAHNSRGNEVIICDDCYSSSYFTCYSCDETHHDNNGNSCNGHTYCDDCYSENFSSCDNCGNIFHRDDMNYHEESETDLCDDCYNEAKKKNKNIKSYNYKPCPVFFGNSSAYLGFELEVDKGNDCDETAESIENEFCYFKEDGSLNEGFEIVSHPCSFEYLKNQKDVFKSMFATLRENSFLSYDTDTCGMHVHISKSVFTTWHLYRFLKFFKENRRFITRISQRKIENLNRWANIDDESFSESEIYNKAKEKNTNCSRYQAINLNNSKTVEIRIFRGTLNIDSFYKNLEFVQALFEYTQKTSTEKICIEDFKLYVSANKDFKNLHNFITTKNL